MPTPPCRTIFVSSVPVPGGGAFGGYDAGDRFCTRIVQQNGTAAMKAALSSNAVGYRAVLGISGGTQQVMQRFAGEWSTCVDRPDGSVWL
jgi:hypothetical protein